MSSVDKTPNLGLNRWQGHEYPKRVDFVDDNDKTDTAIGDLRTNVGDTTTLNTTSKVVVGAVNEVKSGMDNLAEDITNAESNSKSYTDTQIEQVNNSKLDKSGGKITGDVDLEKGNAGWSFTDVVKNQRFKWFHTADQLHLQILDALNVWKANPIQFDFETYITKINNGLAITGDAKVNGNNIWHAGNDGSGSGLTADDVDGYHASQLLTLANSNGDCELLTNGSDLDSLTKTNFYRGENLLNAPPKTHTWAYVLHIRHNAQYVLQIGKGYNEADGIYYRIQHDTNWKPWVKILTENDIGQKLTGEATYTDTIPANTTLTKTIPIGAGYREGKLVYKDNTNNPFRGMLFFDTLVNTAKSSITIGESGYSDAYRPDFRSKALDSELGVLSNSALFVENAYISGSNLTILLKNTDISYARTINVTVDWEVEK